jgi:hypothetical protein
MRKRKPIVLTDPEIDALIHKIKSEELPKVAGKRVPSNCKVCRLGKYCSIINHKLICPWLKQIEEKKDLWKYS